MADYLIDYYSIDGVLFSSVRMVSISDSLAQLEAMKLAAVARPASYKITRLEKSGNIVIRSRLPPAGRTPTA